MGKALLLIVLGTSLAASALYMSRDESFIEHKRVEAEYEGHVLAREAATSAFNIVVGRVKQDFDGYRESDSDVTYRDAKYDVSATTGDDGEVVITATGKYAGFKYRITGSMEKGGQRLFDALTIDGPVTNLDFRDNYYVSGVDVALDGSSATGPHVRGILVTNTSAYSTTLSEADSDNVIGSEGELDIIQGNPLTSLDELESAILNYTGAFLVEVSSNTTYNSETIGSTASPKVVRVNGDVTLKGNFAGYGILYATGDITFEDHAVWHGMVYGNNAEGGIHSFEDDSSVFGSVVLRSAMVVSEGDPDDDDVDDGEECADDNSDKSDKSSKSKKSKKSDKSDKSCKSAKSDKSDKSDKSKKSDKSDKGGGSSSIVEICHSPVGNPANRHTFTISSSVLLAHLAHGDTEGACEADVDTEEGNAFRITLRDNTNIRYSTAALRPLRQLLGQVDIGANAVVVKRSTEGTLK